MKQASFYAAVVGMYLVTSIGTANATIDVVKGSLTCFIGCNKNVVQSIAQGQDHSFEVVGQFVDLSSKVEITGSGVSVSYGTRKGGSRSSIIVKFDVRPDAAVGERTVKMRYAMETNGPDTFRVRVVRRGTISQVQYQRPLAFRPGGQTSMLVAPVNLPLNERVVLIVTGTKLDAIQVKPHSAFRNVRFLPGATDTQAAIEVEFAQSGQGPLLFFDAALSRQDLNSSTSSRFSYEGGADRDIQYGGPQNAGVGGGLVTRPIIGGGNSAPAAFVDVAPRANMANVFRRRSPNPAFTVNGVQFFEIDSQRFCNDMTGNQTRIITIPNPVWGVSNVGTAGVATAFSSQLRSGAAVLDTVTVTTLAPGQTIDFIFPRPNDSRVRVSTFLNRIGCFISPMAAPFFEDPPFTVIVNTNGAVAEAASNQSNNSRNY